MQYYTKCYGCSFLGDKYEDEFFFWEAIIIARKIAMMVAFLLFEDEKAWLLGTAVILVAVVAHSAAAPYEDSDTDLLEFLTCTARRGCPSLLHATWTL